MVYAVVTDAGLIDLMTNHIDEAKEHKEYLKLNDIESEIYGNEEDIKDLIFNSDLNYAWWNEYYELVKPNNYIVIPTEIFNSYFWNLFDDRVKNLEDVLYKTTDLDEDVVNNIIDKYMEKLFGCTPYILDKLLHGEYHIV